MIPLAKTAMRKAGIFPSASAWHYRRGSEKPGNPLAEMGRLLEYA